MPPILFAHRIARGETMDVLTHGHHNRDFTCIDGIVEGVVRLLDQPPPDPACDPMSPNPARPDAP